MPVHWHLFPEHARSFERSFEHLHSDLKKPEPKEKLELLVKLLPYTTPRYENITFSELPNREDKTNDLVEKIIKLQSQKQ